MLYQKVLFTASSFAHIKSFHLPYIQKFHNAGVEVHVACGGKQCNLPGASRLISLPFEKQLHSISNFHAMHTLRRVIQAEKYNVVITHTSLAAFFTRLSVKGMPVRPRVIYMCHGYLFDDASSVLRKTVLLSAERLVSSQTDLLLNMNHYDYQLARQYHLGNTIAVIPGVGVDYFQLDATLCISPDELRFKLCIPDNAFVLFYAAEFSGRKNQAFLIRALKDLPENIYLVLAGEGDLKEACIRQASELGLSSRIRFPGHVSPVGDWYAMADAAVSSSRSEGLPFNIMEAMHFGLPVIATDVKGNNDLIRNGNNGLLFQYGDEAVFIDCVNQLLSSKALRSSLGIRASQDSEQYALSRVFPEIWSHYCSFLPDL